jgi:hypothetical protein
MEYVPTGSDTTGFQAFGVIYDVTPFLLFRQRPSICPGLSLDSAPMPKTPNAERIERLIDAVEHVGEELATLRQVIDEIREEFQWAVRNEKLPPTHIVHITSMPVDPCDPEFGKKVNRISQADIDRQNAEGKPVQQGDLWK